MKKTRDQLKKELVEKFEEAVECVLDWQEKHRTFTLTELEEFVLGLRQEMGEEIAEATLGQMDSKVIIEGVQCEECGNGSLAIERGRYWCPTCQTGVFPPG
jgi:hypothetical protein